MECGSVFNACLLVSDLRRLRVAVAPIVFARRLGWRASAMGKWDASDGNKPFPTLLRPKLFGCHRLQPPPVQGPGGETTRTSPSTAEIRRGFSFLAKRVGTSSQLELEPADVGVFPEKAGQENYWRAHSR